MWIMRRLLSSGLVFVFLAGILYACASGTPTEDQKALISGEVTALKLNVQAQSGTFNAVNQAVAFQYVVKNEGSTNIAGPVSMIDTKVPAIMCPAVNTVGNLNDTLEAGESLTCVASYSIQQADLNLGSITSTATASAGGVTSNTVQTVVQMTPLAVLEFTSNASPTTYNNSGQVINFSFIIKNVGAATLGPAQFVVKSDKLGNINCGAADASLAAGASISCAGAYTTTDTDRTSAELVFNNTASGGGAAGTQTVQIKIANTNVQGNPTTGTYTKGTTVKHTVQAGEWTLQIVRCYGADFNAVKSANPQIADLAKIWPGDVLTIPNIGSNGNIFAPKCVDYYTAQSGDTWNSVATKYNARQDVLQEANKGVQLGGGVRLRIPVNSAGGNPVSGGGSEPIRLTFNANSPKFTLTSSVTVAKVRERYVFTAAQGQPLSVTLTAPTGGLELAVSQVNANALKPQNATLTYSGNIPANGDYYVDVVNVTNSDRQYSLEIVLSPLSSGSERVVDINPGAADSNPSYLAIFNNNLYFSARGLDNNGTELWRYDAANNSVGIVKDILPGPESSNPAYLTEFNGALYFSAIGDGAGIELWRFNGSDAGRLSDINSQGGNANPSYLTVYNGRLYFSASSSDGTGVELWQTDGNTVGRVADIYNGAGNSNPSYLTVYKGALYFSATSNDGFGTEIWKYDGTANPTRVTDINPNVGNANPAYLTVYKDILYFSANSGDGKGTELWKFDGTTASLAADIYNGGDSIPAYPTAFNGLLYFSANGNNGAGYELWKFDGVTASMASDVNKSGDSIPSYLILYNNQLYFSANGGEGGGRELWRFKGP
jgi:ELWxxDGT repeat protein